MLEDFCVPSLPELPKKDESGVRACLIRERQRTANQPRSPVSTRRQTDPQTVPHRNCFAAVDEDVFIDFKDSLAELTICFIASTDVFVMKVCPGVETPVKEKPTEKFYFAREFRAPDPSSIRMHFVITMQRTINTLCSERRVSHAIQGAVIWAIRKWHKLNAALKNVELLTSRSSQTRLEVEGEPPSEGSTNRVRLTGAMREESRKGLGECGAKDPLVMPEGGKLPVSDRHRGEGTVSLQLSVNKPA